MMSARVTPVDETAPDEQDTRCEFWFVRAEKILKFEGETLPDLLRDSERRDWLEKMPLSTKKALRGEYVKTFCAVSHRWERKDDPDPNGTQLKEIQKFLKKNPDIKWIWFDYWCMWQGERTEEETKEFINMLHHINLLYLSVTVLILMDSSYVSRFWTLFESWLSMQEATKEGLRFAPESCRRCVIKLILTAKDALNEDVLVKMWKDLTPEQVRDKLGANDVQVTNESDKEFQLPKVTEFSKQIGNICQREPGLAHRRNPKRANRRIVAALLTSCTLLLLMAATLVYLFTNQAQPSPPPSPPPLSPPPNPPPPPNPQFVQHAGACRTSTGSGGTFIHFPSVTLTACAENCLSYSRAFTGKCYAYEWSQSGNCEVHSAPISYATGNSATLYCFILE